VDNTSQAVQFPFARKKVRESTFLRFIALGLEESLSPFLDPYGRNLSRNLSLKAAITAAVLLLSAFLFRLFLPESPVDYVLLTLCLLVVAPTACIESIEDLSKKDINIDVLMTVAALGACLIGRGFEGALLLVLFALSGAMEDAVTLKAKKNLTDLEELLPEKATIIDDGVVFERAVSDIRLQDVLLVRHGEMVALDGTVISGTGALTLAHLTGEARPQAVSKGDKVLSGARLIEGSIEIRVECTSSDSTLAKLVKLITVAHERKPVLTRSFERFGRYYAAGIMTAAALVAAFLPFFGVEFLGDSGALIRALSFLITASPCALVLAVPIAYISSLGLFARKGILVKGSHILDALVICQAVAFDKTGTLTYGVLKLCSDVDPENLRAFAAVERGSNHPIAIAIAEEAIKKGLTLPEVSEFISIPGEGVEGKVSLNGNIQTVFIGSVEGALKRISTETDLMKSAEEARQKGFGTACGVIDGKGYLLQFSDTIREGAAASIERLKSLGKEVLILTGDSKENADRVADEIGIDIVEAQLKPEDKLKCIQQLSEQAGLVMVGDGINDAPALARATVGVSMGTMSSATAREASDVILLHDRIDLLDWMFQQAIRTQHVVWQNLILALLVIVLASMSALLGELSLWVAVVLHEGGTVLVGLNGLRLLREKSR